MRARPAARRAGENRATDRADDTVTGLPREALDHRLRAACCRARIRPNLRSPKGPCCMKSFNRRSAAVAAFGVVALVAYVGCQVAPSRQSRPSVETRLASPTPDANVAVVPAPLAEPQGETRVAGV